MPSPQSKRSPAFQFYPKDFLTSPKVVLMSMTERGVYMTLLSHCWLDNGLPTDLRMLAKFVGMKATQFERIWNNSPLHDCFHERAGKLYNERLDRERRIQAEYRKKQKENADKRWQSHGIAVAMPERHCDGNAPLSSSPIPNPQSVERDTRRAPIHDTSHRKHAHCGRVCLHASLFGEFVRRRNHDGADAEIRAWAMDVEREWAERPDETGDAFDFWRARYAEKWPAVVASSRVPAWVQRAKAGQS